MLEQTDIEDDRHLGGIPTEKVRIAKVAASTAERLRNIVERIERLVEEKKALSSDISDIFTEAKSAGYDVKVLRKLIAERKLDPSDAEEQMSLLDVYRHALGGA